MVGASRNFAAVFFSIAMAARAQQDSERYRELKMAVDRNSGFAHGTRGMNMYTLVALRGCVTGEDIPTLAQLLEDKDRITRMSAAQVLGDLGADGLAILKGRLAKVRDASEKMMLQDAVSETTAATYRPILQYPLTDRERARIRGCKPR